MKLFFYYRLNQKTPFNSNATSICHNIGLMEVDGIEASFRYKIVSEYLLTADVTDKIIEQLHDKMTQCR